METRDKAPWEFAQKRLPWLIAAAALLVYLITLSRWVRLESLATIGKVTGWDWTPAYYAPLFFLVTTPFRLLPASLQPVALNIFTALTAALSLALLARTAALLPFDRTRDERLRERSPQAVLSTTGAWVAPLGAVLLCGLELTFWEHATAATVEMFDLLFFAYLVRCLLEYRVSRREVWLYKFAVVYGLAITNNYALIPFFPCALVALVWLKGVSFFKVGFLARMLGCGVGGLLAYLLLPVLAVSTGQASIGVWTYVRTIWLVQRYSLASNPPYVVVLLSFTSLFPLLIRGIRWPATQGDTNLASAQVATTVGRLVQLLLLAACLSVFFNPKWSPRVLGREQAAFLPFYYLAALSVAYLAGYFLLMLRPLDRRAFHRDAVNAPGALWLGPGFVLAVALVAAAVLASRNWGLVGQHGQGLAQMADLLEGTLPKQPAYLVGDEARELLLAEATLHRHESSPAHVVINSRLLEARSYHEQLARRYPGRWPALPPKEKLPEPIDSAYLADLMTALARSNEVWYLHPSMGFFYESLYAQPRGLVQRMALLPTNAVLPPVLEPAQVKENQAFWERAAVRLGGLRAPGMRDRAEGLFLTTAYSRVLNAWGVSLQREGRLGEAAKWFQLARELNPNNSVAGVNLECNQRLARGPLADVDLTQTVELKSQQRTWDELLELNGPFDDPLWCFRTGLAYAQGGLYRQALLQFERVRRLLPRNVTAELWGEAMRVMQRYAAGDMAEAERLGLALRERFPREDIVLEALTQVYLVTGRFPNALASVAAQLALNPDNPRALLNQAAANIQMKAYDAALPPLDRLLAKQPGNTAAIMNRAIAHLQSDKLDAAQRDYEDLRKALPQYYAVYYGLGEIAYRRKDTNTALENYERYLKYGHAEAAEYKAVAQRVKDLQGGQPRR